MSFEQFNEAIVLAEPSDSWGDLCDKVKAKLGGDHPALPRLQRLATLEAMLGLSSRWPEQRRNPEAGGSPRTPGT